MDSDIGNKIFEFAYELALRDATIRTAYKGNKAVLRRNNTAKKIIKDYIDSIIKGEPTDFDSVASDVEQSFTEYVKPKKENVIFTFGNTQKLINMTVKYMYIATYDNEKIRDRFKNCHCPLDSYMRDKVWAEIKNCDDSDIAECRNFLSKHRFYNCSWSKIKSDGREIYDKFQETVRFLAEREGITPVNFDYKYWNADN